MLIVAVVAVFSRSNAWQCFEMGGGGGDNGVAITNNI